MRVGTSGFGVKNQEGAELDYTGTDDYGKYVFLPISTFTDQTQVNFIIRPGGWSEQTGDINVQYADFPLQSDNARHLYLVNMEEKVYTSPEAVLAGRILASEFTSANRIYVATNNDMASYDLKLDGVTIDAGVTSDTYSAALYKYEFILMFRPLMKSILWALIQLRLVLLISLILM